ncbi:MAG: hypothetical protein Q4A16_09225 [Lautropia sp.]|nr:hypothetical protein [Lautropia sp.]
MSNSSLLNRIPLLNGDQPWLPIMMGAAFLAAGAAVGLVVATGDLILIALALGGIAGLLLLNALPIAVWILLIGVMLINGPVGFFSPGMARISWLFSLLGIFMAGAAVLYSAVGNKRFQRPLPPFIFTAIAFILLAIITSFFSEGSLNELAGGAKRHFQFWGVMFLLAVVPFTERQVRGWMLFLVGMALVQLPFTLYQRVVLVPQVMSFDRPGFVPFDIIVGTFEGSMTGGGASSIMAMFQLLMLFGVFCAWRERLLNGFVTLLLAAAFLVPLGLGETKVVMALVPVILFSAYFDMVSKRPLAFLGIVVATLVVGAVLGYFYFIVQVAGDIAEMNAADNIRNTIEYNFGSGSYYATGVNRLTAIPYWFESQSWNNPMHTLFGTGLGSSYGVDALVPDPGHMFVAHPGMHIDLLSASTILWDFGLVGALLYYSMIFGAIRIVLKCFGEIQSAWDRVLCRTLMASLAVTLLLSVYSNTGVILVSHGFLMFFTLGLVAWRYRHGPLAPTAAELGRGGGGAPLRPGFAGSGFASKWGGKVEFPTDGVLPAAQLAAQRGAQRLLPGGAEGAGQMAPTVAGQDVPSVPNTVAAGETARSAFPKGSVPGGIKRSFAGSDPGHDTTAAADVSAAAPGVPGASGAPVPGLAATAQGSTPEQQPRSAFPRGAAFGAGGRRGAAIAGMTAQRNTVASRSQTAFRPASAPARTAAVQPPGPREPNIDVSGPETRPMFADDDLAEQQRHRSGQRTEPRIKPTKF